MKLPGPRAAPSAPTQQALRLPEWLAAEVHASARAIPALRTRLQQALARLGEEPVGEALCAEGEPAPPSAVGVREGEHGMGRAVARTLPGRVAPPANPGVLFVARGVPAAGRKVPPPVVAPDGLRAATTPRLAAASRPRGNRSWAIRAQAGAAIAGVLALGLAMARPSRPLWLATFVFHVSAWLALVAWLRGAWAALPHGQRFVGGSTVTPDGAAWRLMVPGYQLYWLAVVVERMGAVAEEPRRRAPRGSRALLRLALFASVSPLVPLAPLVWMVALQAVDRPLMARTP